MLLPVHLCSFVFLVSLPELVDIQAFCTHVVWRKPSDLPCEYISGYDVRLVNLVTNQGVIRRVDDSGTFYSLGYLNDAKESTGVQVYNTSV